jgi:CDGSH-type Zn-finger protein
MRRARWSEEMLDGKEVEMEKRRRNLCRCGTGLSLAERRAEGEGR